MKICHVLLGAYGDQISTALPLAWHDHISGNSVTVISSKPYAPLFDGTSYIDCIPWDGHYSQPLPAFQWAVKSQQFDSVLLPQHYGTNAERLTSSFVMDMWRLVGKYDLFQKLPTVFDRRDAQRESKLIPVTDKPILVLAHSGYSGVFPQIEKLVSLVNEFSAKYEIVNISNWKCERIYDLLGLYEKAACLVATDSAPLHLSNAIPKLPVVALSPDGWTGAPRMLNHALWLRYSEFDGALDRIRGVLENPKPVKYRLLHVWQDYPRFNSGAVHRHAIAKQTWKKERESGLWDERIFLDTEFERNAKTDVGDKKPVPYITDLLNKAANEADENQIIVFSNDDNCFVPSITETLLREVPLCGAAYSWRYEILKITKPLTDQEARKGWQHCGADVFAFTKSWWKEHGGKMPDMFLAFEQFDLVLKKLILLTGGKEVGGLVYHSAHTPDWITNRDSPAGEFNRKQAVDWYQRNNLKWE